MCCLQKFSLGVPVNTHHYLWVCCWLQEEWELRDQLCMGGEHACNERERKAGEKVMELSHGGY